MSTKELIEELKKYPADLEVMAAGERAEKVLLEECQGEKYIRIFEPFNAGITGRNVERIIKL